MTNEEKLKEMFPFYKDMEDIEITQTTLKRAGAIEMAKWKDHQFAEEKKKWIKKACEWLEDNVDGYMVIDEGGDGFMHFSLINEFRKAMEE